MRIAFDSLMAVDPLFFRLVGKDFFVENSCTHCGLCVRNCPMKNIYEKDGMVKFKSNCNGCLGCTYSCPKQAIQFKHLKFLIVPGGYNIKKILNPPVGSVESSAAKISPSFQRYVSDENF